VTTNRVLDGKEFGCTVLEALKNMPMSWTNDVESQRNLMHHIRSSCAHLDWKKSPITSILNSLLISHKCVTTKLWPQTLWPQTEKLAKHVHMKNHNFGVQTSNSSETEGGVLKHHASGPKPNFSLEKSADSTVKVSDMRITLKEQWAAQAMDTESMETKPGLEQLHKSTTKHCAEKVAEIWEARSGAAVHRKSLTEFWTKAKSHPQCSSDPRNCEECKKCLSAMFERTRVVKVFRHDGCLFLKCTCCKCEQNGCECVHIAAVANTFPNPQNIAIGWHKPRCALHLTGNRRADELFEGRSYQLKTAISFGSECYEARACVRTNA
jgi:hypothetical protein